MNNTRQQTMVNHLMLKLKALTFNVKVGNDKAKINLGEVMNCITEILSYSEDKIINALEHLSANQVECILLYIIEAMIESRYGENHSISMSYLDSYESKLMTPQQNKDYIKSMTENFGDDNIVIYKIRANFKTVEEAQSIVNELCFVLNSLRAKAVVTRVI